MVIFTRRPGETLVIENPAGEGIQVAVLSQKGNRVRIHIDGPASGTILREELVVRVVTS